MHLPRRKFLRTSLLSVASAGLALSAARVTLGQKHARGQMSAPVQRSNDLSLQVQRDPVFRFKPDTFKPYVGGIFTAPNSLGQPIELELLSLKVYKPENELRYTKNFASTESFSLTFKAAAQLPPFTSIHKMNHPSLGRFDLFLTKRVSDNGDLLYDAVINHIQ